MLEQVAGRARPLPTNISTNSEPEIERRKARWPRPRPPEPAGVCPFRRAHQQRAPGRSRAPICLYRPGLCRKSTISVSASRPLLARPRRRRSYRSAPGHRPWRCSCRKVMALPPPMRFASSASAAAPMMKMAMGITQLSNMLMIGEVSLGSPRRI